MQFWGIKNNVIKLNGLAWYASILLLLSFFIAQHVSIVSQTSIINFSHYPYVLKEPTNVSLTYTMPLTAGVEVTITPQDKIKYQGWQVDWYTSDGITDTQVATDQQNYYIRNSDVPVGNTVYAKLTSGSYEVTTIASNPVEARGASLLQLDLIADVTELVLQEGDTISLTPLFNVDGIPDSNTTFTYQWFLVFDQANLGKAISELTASEYAILSANSDQHPVTQSDAVEYLSVEVTADNGTDNVKRVMSFASSYIRLPLTSDYKDYEYVMLEEALLKNDLRLWLDASDQSTLFSDDTCLSPIMGDGSEVACWLDKSSYGHHVLNPNSTQPLGEAYTGTTYTNPIWQAQSSLFSGMPSIKFLDRDVNGNAQEQFLGNVIPVSDRWGREFSMFHVLAFNSTPASYASSFASIDRVRFGDASEWPTDGKTTGFQANYISSDNSFKWSARYWDSSIQNDGTGGPSADINFSQFVANLSQVLTIMNTCEFDGSADYDCELATYNEGAFVNNEPFTVNPDVTFFQQYRVNTNRGTDVGAAAEHAEIMIFDKPLDDCEHFIVNRYIGLKLSRAIGSIGRTKTLTSHSEETETLGYHVEATNACTQNFITDSGASGYMTIDFKSRLPSESDFNIVDKDEFLVFAHDGSAYQLSDTTSFPNANKITDRQWHVEFDSGSSSIPQANANAPIKQLSIGFRAVDTAFGLANENYPKPYLLIADDAAMTSNVQEFDGAYDGSDTIIFNRKIDVEEGQFLKLGFDFQATNNAPTSQDATLYVDQNFTFQTSDFPYTDSDNDAFNELKIISLPSTGALQFQGNPVSVNDVIPVSQIGDLVYLLSSISATLPDSISFQVSDGINFSATQTLTLEFSDFVMRAAPQLDVYRLGDLVKISTEVIIDNDEILFKPDVSYVWWAVDLANEINDAYNSSVHTLLSNTNQYSLSGIGGKYLLVEATHQDGQGNTHVNRLNLGQIMPTVAAERPTDTWPSELDLGTDYVKIGDTLSASPLVRAGETTPPNIEYCFINGMTGAVLQTCSTTNTYTVQNAEAGATIEVVAKFSDASDANIAEQRISKVLLPTATTLDLSYPRFDITSPNNSQAVSVNPVTRFDGTGASLQWWKKTANGTYETINGETSATYTPNMEDVGDQLYLVATMIDGNDSREYVLTTPLTDPVHSDLIDIYNAVLTLQYEIPLHPNDEVTLLRKTAFDNVVAGLDPNISLDFMWETSSDNGINWNTPASESTFSSATTLQTGMRYRFHLHATHTVTNENIPMFSDTSPEVVNSSDADLDMTYTFKSDPIQDIPLLIYSEMKNADNSTQYFTHREIDWYSADGEALTNTRTALATNSLTYAPNNTALNTPLLAHIKYYDTNNLLSEYWVETPNVYFQDTTNDLTNVCNQLTDLSLFPNEPSVNATIVLNMQDRAFLRDPTNVTVDYQWQSGDESNGFTDIGGATSDSYQITQNEVNTQLRLKITLTDLNNDAIDIYTPNSFTVRDDPNRHIFMPRLVLNDNDELTLTAASTFALNAVVTANAASNINYEWRRIAGESGHFNTNGETTSTSALLTLGDATSDDNNARHQLKISIDGNENLDFYSVITPVWQQNTAADQFSLQRHRYHDSVQIVSGTSPAQENQTLVASTYSANPLNDIPPPVSYQWQQKNGANWINIPSSNDAVYQVSSGDVSAGGVRVQTTPTDTMGSLSTQTSQERATQSTTVDSFNAEIHPYSDSLAVGQILFLSHRTLTNDETVTFEWHRMADRSWDNAAPIPNADGVSYTVSSGDSGNYIGAKIHIEKNSTTLTATTPVVGMVLTNTDAVSVLNAQILPEHPYQNSDLDHRISIFKNGVLDENTTQATNANWFTLDAKAHLFAPQLWTPLNATTLSSAVQNKYLLLSLSHTENGYTLVQHKVTVEPVAAANTPSDFAQWHSQLSLSDLPALTNSTPVFSATGGESVANNTGIFSSEVSYFSPESPWLQYASIQALWNAQGYGIGYVFLNAAQEKDNDASVKRALPMQGFALIKDTDNDGIPNNTDKDIDNDGIDNRYDDDVDNDGQLNTNDNDIDEDGIANSNDPDIDGDGIANANDSDMDGDGVINGSDADMDGDGVDNASDTDSDADMILDNVDAVIANNDDLDGDGINNAIDDDADGDGVSFHNDAFPADHRYHFDADGDGNGDTVNVEALTTITITLDDTYSLSANEVVLFDPMNNSFGLTAGDNYQLVNVNALFGTANITPDQKIHYQAPSDLPQQSMITYQIMDQHGGKRHGILALNAATPIVNAPTFAAISALEINAQSKITNVNLTPPSATDNSGNPATVTLHSGRTRLPSGLHLVYWQAEDSVGRTQYHAQRLHIHPQINFKPRDNVYEKGINPIQIRLSGVSPTYPLTVPITFDGSSTASAADFTNTFPANVVISHGTQGVLELDVIDDSNADDAETLLLEIDANLNQGINAQRIFTVYDSVVNPSVHARVVDTEGKSHGRILENYTDQFLLSAAISHPDASAVMTHTWSHKVPSATTFTAMTHGTLTDDDTLALPNALVEGHHQFKLSSQSSLGGTPIERYVSVYVYADQTLTDIDVDEDGISDLLEGLKDDDGDLIPNYLDDYDGCDRLTTIDSTRSDQDFLVQVHSGHCMQIGPYSLHSNSYSPILTSSDISAQSPLPSGQSLANDNDPAHTTNFSTANILNFTVNELESEYIKVVLPLKVPARTGGVIRKYTEANGWFDFIEQGEEQIRFAQGEAGKCPPPGSADYQDDLVVGGYCVEMTIQDGGIHDNDGEINGKIDDPSYFSNTASLIDIDDPINLPTYTATSNETQYSISFDVCNYIVSCTDISVDTPNVNSASNTSVSGTTINLTFAASSSDINTSFNLTVTTPNDAQSTSVNINIDVPELPSPAPPTSNEDEGEGRISWITIFILFFIFNRTYAFERAALIVRSL